MEQRTAKAVRCLILENVRGRHLWFIPYDVHGLLSVSNS